MLLSAFHKLVTSIWTKEEWPDQWKESIILQVHKKGVKTDCNNYRGISLFSTSYKMLSNILLSKLSPYADEIIGDHQCGFRSNRSTTDQIFYIQQILEKKMGVQWNSTSAVHRLQETYVSMRREVLHSILLEFGVAMKPLRFFFSK
jgi:hypothetical protein